jgi:NADH-quinone oxidoreductase subunit N
LDPQNYKVKFGWSIVFLSLAGLPPFAGFFSKFYVLLVAHHYGHYLAVFVGICTSLISAYYYLRVIKLLWFEENISTPHFVFTGYEVGALHYTLQLVFCLGIGLFLTISFVWNEPFLFYCLDLAKSCCFPLTKYFV